MERSGQGGGPPRGLTVWGDPMKRTITISPDGTVTITEETEAPARILAPWPTTAPSVPWPTYTPPPSITPAWPPSEYVPIWLWQDPFATPTTGKTWTSTSPTLNSPPMG